MKCPICKNDYIKKEKVVSPSGYKTILYVHEIIDRETFKVSEGCTVQEK